MKVIEFIERALTKIFCGPECWLVEYSLITGRAEIEVMRGVTKTHLPLSKVTNQIEGSRLGSQIASEISYTARVMLGVRADMVRIHKVERIW